MTTDPNPNGMSAAPAQAAPFFAAQLEYAAFSLQATLYVSIAAFLMWFWDILLNLDVEISVLWQRKGVILKAMYSWVSS